MPVPSKKDLDTLEKNIAKWQKMLGADGHLSETKLIGMLRDSLRKVWMRNPVKLLKLNLARIPDYAPETRTKWLYQCESCGGKFKSGDVEVDHKTGNHTLRKVEDFPVYYERILDVTLDDLQILCKGCHALKTYMEANPELSEEQAVLAKRMLAWVRDYPKAAQQKTFLSKYGYNGKEVANEDMRKAIILALIEKEELIGY